MLYSLVCLGLLITHLSAEIKEELSKRRLVVLVRRILSVVLLGVAVLLITLLISVGMSALSGGVKVGLIDIPTAVTLLLIDGLLAAITYLLGRRANKPILYVADHSKTRMVGNKTLYGVHVFNTGEDGALECQAKLGIKIKTDNVFDLPRSRTAVVTSRKFRKVWGDVVFWCYQNKPEVAIRPDGNELFEFLRVVPTPDGSFHLEIPSKTGWNPVLVALKPDDYEGKIKISPMNGKPKSRIFFIKYNRRTKSVSLTFPFVLE